VVVENLLEGDILALAFTAMQQRGELKQRICEKGAKAHEPQQGEGKVFPAREGF
jgi:hypothetical protein